MDRLFRLYATFNDELFGGELPAVVFSTDPARRATFTFAPSSTIEIGTEFCVASAARLLADLVHVMVHVRNHQQGIPDHNANQYHNSHFRSAALAVGLCVAHHATRGWGVTSVEEPSSDLRYVCPEGDANKRLRGVLIRAKLRLAELAEVRAELAGKVAGMSRRQSLIKYVCGCAPPHNAVRSGRTPTGPNALDITCNVCRRKFSPATVKRRTTAKGILRKPPG